MTFNPETVSYTKADIQKSATQAQLNEGWYTFAPDNCKIDTNDKGDVVAQMKCSPVDPEDGETRLKPSAFLRITLPLNSSDEHKAPDWAASICHEFLHAIFPEDIPAVPRKNEAGKWMYQGEEIEAEDVQAAKEEVYEKVFETAMKWCKDVNLVKDYSFVGKIVHKDGYVNIKAIRPELPSGESFVAKGSFEFRPVREEKPAAKKSTAKKTK